MTRTVLMAAVLACAPVAALADRIEINGAELHVETIGEGPAVMVLHGGLGLDHTYLRPYFDHLAEDHTVIYYDHFGNGRSDYPEDYAEMTMERLASDADALRAHLGFERMVLIGHSYGGFIAQQYAVDFPDTLAGLVLVDTVPAFDYAPTVSGTDEQMAAFGALFSGPQADNDSWRANWGLVIQMYFADYDAALGAEIDAGTVYSYQAWNAAGALLATFNMVDAILGFDMPVLAMAGAQDGITPPGPGAERIADLAPMAELAVFENSAHYPFIEEEEAFFAVLTDWLIRLN